MPRLSSRGARPATRRTRSPQGAESHPGNDGGQTCERSGWLWAPCKNLRRPTPEERLPCGRLVRRATPGRPLGRLLLPQSSHPQASGVVGRRLGGLVPAAAPLLHPHPQRPQRRSPGDSQGPVPNPTLGRRRPPLEAQHPGRRLLVALAAAAAFAAPAATTRSNR